MLAGALGLDLGLDLLPRVRGGDHRRPDGIGQAQRGGLDSIGIHHDQLAALARARPMAYARAFMERIMAGISFVLNMGGPSWTHFCFAVVVVAARKRGPLRFVAFLDWAHDAELLRVSGTAYQFRHLQLQDWLISHSQSADDREPALPTT
jgi:hypothetical protein